MLALSLPLFQEKFYKTHPKFHRKFHMHALTILWCESMMGPKRFTGRLVELLNNSFSVFKQHYTYFHTLFHLHVFQKITNNITQTSLPNEP